jgi:hypothetical protein
MPTTTPRPQTWLAVALSSQGPSSHCCLRETSCASHPPSQGLAPLERGGARYRWPCIDVGSIWRRTWLFPLLLLCHTMDAFIHFSNLSAAALAPSQKQTQQRGSHSWMPGWPCRTQHPQGQPPTWFVLRQLSTGHACLCLGSQQRRQHGSGVHNSTSLSDALFFGDKHSCAQGRSCCKCFSELAECPHDALQQSPDRHISNYSGTVPWVCVERVRVTGDASSYHNCEIRLTNCTNRLSVIVSRFSAKVRVICAQ